MTSLQPPQRDHSAWHRSRGTRASPRVAAYADTQTHRPQTHTVLLSDTGLHSQMYKAHTSRNRGTDTNSIHSAHTQRKHDQTDPQHTCKESPSCPPSTASRALPESTEPGAAGSLRLCLSSGVFVYGGEGPDDSGTPGGSWAEGVEE